MSQDTVSDESGTNLPPLCTCRRSATGFCTGLHRLSDEEWDAMVFDEAFNPGPPPVQE